MISIKTEEISLNVFAHVFVYFLTSYMHDSGDVFMRNVLDSGIFVVESNTKALAPLFTKLFILCRVEALNVVREEDSSNDEQFMGINRK